MYGAILGDIVGSPYEFDCNNYKAKDFPLFSRYSDFTDDTVMTLAVVHTLGITVDPITALILSVLAAIGACGASGVAGGSLLLIPMACSLFGIPNDIAMQAVGVGFIIGVIQDSCETALNSSTDALFTATAEYASWRKEGRKLPV